MRTKTLLLSAVALAAGLVASQAQSNVYSANIVGYVNIQLPANTFVLANTPLNNNSSNDLNTLLPGLPNKSTVQIWTGTAFSPSTKVSSGWSPDLTVNPGQGYFISSFNAAQSNTYVGSVVVGFGGSVTNPLPAGTFQLVGNPVPFQGFLNDTNIGLNTLPNKSTVQVWTGTAFSPATKVSSGWSPNLPLAPAQGFFVSSFSPTNWVQILPLQ